MENTRVKEGIEILKKLSLKNQAYFMTLIRLAEAAESTQRMECETSALKRKKKN